MCWTTDLIGVTFNWNLAESSVSLSLSQIWTKCMTSLQDHIHTLQLLRSRCRVLSSPAAGDVIASAMLWEVADLSSSVSWWFVGEAPVLAQGCSTTLTPVLAARSVSFTGRALALVCSPCLQVCWRYVKWLWDY